MCGCPQGVGIIVFLPFIHAGTGLKTSLHTFQGNRSPRQDSDWSECLPRVKAYPRGPIGAPSTVPRKMLQQRSFCGPILSVCNLSRSSIAIHKRGPRRPLETRLKRPRATGAYRRYRPRASVAIEHSHSQLSCHSHAEGIRGQAQPSCLPTYPRPRRSFTFWNHQEHPRKGR